MKTAIFMAFALALMVTRVSLAQDATSEIPLDVRLPDAVSNSSATKTQSSPISPTPAIPGMPQIPDLTKRENFSAAMQIIVLLTILSLAPAILIMMTSFTRIVIVLSLLRQAMGTQQLPPNQVLIGLSLFMTFLVMGPTWDRVNDEALKPYMDGRIEQQTALVAVQQPLRDFMEKNIH